MDVLGDVKRKAFLPEIFVVVVDFIKRHYQSFDDSGLVMVGDVFADLIVGELHYIRKNINIKARGLIS